MKFFAAVVLLAAPLAAAQDDPVDRQVQRLKDQLQLSDEQTGKVREVLKKNNDDLRGVLTDEQKERYDGMLRATGGGGRARGAGGGQPQFGFLAQGFDDLKKQLSLSDEQMAKINEVRDALREEIRTMFQNRQGGNFNFEESRLAFQQKIEEATKKIREALTDEQKPKYDEMVKTLQEGVRTLGGFGGAGAGRGGSTDDRVNRVMETLKIENADEAAAVKELVHKVVELQQKAETAQREARTKIDDISKNKELSDEAVGDKIEELRKGLREADKELGAARQELSEVVTKRQELELIRRGILK